MGATSPLWVTVLLAVLAPVLTLLGVWLTQRSSDRRAREEADRVDRRAVREAELRLEAQREHQLAERRFECYLQVLQTLDDIYEHLRTKRTADSMEQISGGLFVSNFDFDAWRADVARFSGLTNQLVILGNREAIVSAHRAEIALNELTNEAMTEKRVIFTWAFVREFIRGRRDLIRAIRQDWGIAGDLSDEEISYYGPKL